LLIVCLNIPSVAQRSLIVSIVNLQGVLSFGFSPPAGIGCAPCQLNLVHVDDNEVSTLWTSVLFIASKCLTIANEHVMHVYYIILPPEVFCST